MKSLSAKTFQCGVTIQGLTTLSGTVYLTGITNTASWDHVIVGTTAQGQLYTRTYAQLMSDITSGIGLSGYVPTSRTLTINGVSYDLTANRSWTITTPYVSKLQHTVKAGVAINKGQAVYVTSADGTNMIVGLASNASEATSSKTMGLLDATVSTNGFANVVTEGLLDGLDTSTAGAAGDPVWLGTGGNLIYGLTNKPYAPAHLVFIGIVTRKNANNGEIFVKVQNGFELDELHDVDLKTTAPINGHLLGYNGTLWVNKTIAGWLGYTPANASGTTNYISKFTGSTTLGNSQIFDDGTNVGIGTTTMFGKLSISSGNSNGIRIDTNGGGYSALNIGGTGSLTVDAPGITGGRFQITDSGNVGIGTTNPSKKLQIGISNATHADEGILLQSSGGYGEGAIYHDYGQSTGVTAFKILNTYSGSQIALSQDTYSSTGSPGSIRLYTAASGGSNTPVERMRITSDGNVGIGTTSPTATLHTVGSGIVNIVQSSNTVSYTQYYNTSTGTNSSNDGLTVGLNGIDAYVFSREAGNLILGTLDTERVRITSAGLVGIGTSSPGAKLHVAGGEIRVDAGQAVTLDIANSMYLVGASNQLRLYNGGNPVVNITTGGNVGIGTTNPAEKLSVNGTFSSNSLWTVSAAISFWGGYPTAYGGLTWDTGQATVYATSGNKLYLASNGSSPDMTIDTSGNVGIGTTTTGSKLHVLLNGNTSGGPTGNVASFQNSSAGNNAYISLFGAYNAEAGIIFTDESEQYKGKIGYDNISEYMYFQTDGSEKARITSTGNVGIGVTNPSYKLDVNGSFNFVTSGVYLTYNSGVLYHGNYYQFPSGSYYYLYGRTGMGLIFGSNNAEVGRFDLFGNLGIGTTSPNEKLHVAGNVHAYAAGGIDSGLFASTSAGSTSIAIRSNGVTHFNGGNVGIGTNSPNTKLTILGGDDASGTGVLELATGGGTNLKLGGNSAYSWIQSHSSKPLRINELGNSVIFNLGGGAVGIGTSSPATLLDVNGVITATGGNSTNWNTAYSWGNHSSAGYVPQARTLTINGTTYDLSANRSWTIATTTPGGSNTQFQYNSSGTLAGASALTYDSGTNRVGINQASPGYDLDVNGQVRVQDKLRVGNVNSGNGVVHMSSTATINPSATTIVWSQNVSVGMCAFIEYYILNNNTTTDQRAGTIMVTWNQSGTPTIAHTETTTPDIGSTTAINFTSSLVGSDARINAVNSSSAPYTIVMSYKYF